MFCPGQRQDICKNIMMTRIVPPFSIFNIDLKMRPVHETGRSLVEVKVEIDIHSALEEPLHRERGTVLMTDVLPTGSTVGSSRDNHRRRHPSSSSQS
jgi:hypothetical protein